MNEARYLVNNGYIDPKNMIGDYYTVQLSVGEGIKLESGAVIIDKEGNVYGMVTLGLGGSISAAPFTIGVGFLSNKQNGYISAITGWSGNINAIGLIGGTVGISQSGISGEFDIGGAAGISGMVGYTWYVGNVYDEE